MKIEPLSKDIYKKAKELDVQVIELQFSGGNDEGYLNVNIFPDIDRSFAQEVETWAWNVYQYSGAGEGHDYGDNIKYNLANKTATHNEWYMARQDEAPKTQKLKVE